MDPSVVVAFEGNIGAGKSTLLQSLEDRVPNATVGAEKWQDFAKELSDFYTSPTAATAFSLQKAALRSISEVIVRGRQTRPFLVERSPASCTDIFATALHRRSLLTRQNLSDLRTLRKLCAAEPDAYVYLYSSPDCAWKRIQSRAREEEKMITLEYVQLIHETHESVFNPTNAHPPTSGTPSVLGDCVVAIYADQPKHQVAKDALEALSLIAESSEGDRPTLTGSHA